MVKPKSMTRAEETAGKRRTYHHFKDGSITLRGGHFRKPDHCLVCGETMSQEDGREPEVIITIRNPKAQPVPKIAAFTPKRKGLSAVHFCHVRCWNKIGRNFAVRKN